MSENTKIEWATHTFNPWEGCQKVGPGCDNCYAENRNARFAGGTAINWGPGAPRRRTSPANWALPVKWNKRAGLMQSAWGHGVEMHGGNEVACIAAGFIKPQRPKVFCASLADVFDNAVPVEWRMDLFKLIAETPHLDWLILTKRIGNVMPMCSGDSLMFDLICDRVWLGATIVTQEEADRDIKKLLAVPAHKRFLSMEPLLGRVDLCEPLGMWWNQTMGCFEGDGAEFNRKGYGGSTGIDWVIVGGESGPGARPMHPDWARSLRDQCQAAGVPFLFKQWGEWGNDGRVPMLVSIHEKSHFLTLDGKKWDGPSQCCPKGTAAMLRVGKKAAGRLLDGITHDGFPS